MYAAPGLYDTSELPFRRCWLLAVLIVDFRLSRAGGPKGQGTGCSRLLLLLLLTLDFDTLSRFDPARVGAYAVLFWGSRLDLERDRL